MNSSFGRAWVTLGLAVAACGGAVSKSESTGGPERAPTGLETTGQTSKATVEGSGASSTGSDRATAASSSSQGETSSTAIGSGSASTGQSYSQNANAPLADDAGDFPWITCYGQVDGSSCLISDINGGSSLGGGVHSVDCSAGSGLCSCLLSPQSSWTQGTTIATFPFTRGTCPAGSATSGVLGSVDASACASRAAALFARCGW